MASRVFSIFPGSPCPRQRDNTTAVSFVKKMGGMSCLVRDCLMADLWKLAAKHGCWLSITHIPGIQNVAADRASRWFNDRTVFIKSTGL